MSDTETTTTADDRFIRNSDGSSIYKLITPAKVNGDETDRVTIPAITGKHARRLTWLPGVTPTIGQMVDFAAAIVIPTGVVDAMTAGDAFALGFEVAAQLNKSTV
jgi:hypothetical protein